jgi:hypothetical protein
MTLAPVDIQRVVGECAAHSDCPAPILFQYARLFQSVMQRTEGNVLEIGTRDGGSAKMWLDLLDPPRFVMTVDPYGAKPYEGIQLYGHSHYLAAKRLLAPYPNHAHFLGTSLDFLERMKGWTYWNLDEFPLAPLAFAFLDGEHTWEAVRAEVEALTSGWMAPGGVVLVDNAYEPNHPRRPIDHIKELRGLGYAVEPVAVTGAAIRL